MLFGLELVLRGAVLINMLFLGESKSVGKVVSVIFIVIGVVGLKALS